MEGTSSFGEPTGQADASFDVDTALSEIESGGSHQHAPPSAGSLAEGLGIDPPAGSQPTAQELAFKWNDQEIKVPYNDPRVTQWASQGYDYSQRMNQFNQERKAFDAQTKEYRELNKFFTDNPQAYQQVINHFQGKQNLPGQAQPGSQDPIAQLAELGGHDNPFVKVIGDLNQKVSKAESYIQRIEQEELFKKHKEDDAKLDQTIRSTQEKYKSLDWASFDQSGMNLERRVLNHASEIGTQNFEVAFKDLMHDDLLKRAQETAKQAYVAEIQQKKQAGLLGTTPTPTQGFQPAKKNIKNQSYNSIYEDIMSEVNAMNGVRA